MDRSQIRQVLLNLYINALEAMLEGGEIHVHTENFTVDENYVKPFKINPILADMLKSPSKTAASAWIQRPKKRSLNLFYDKRHDDSYRIRAYRLRTGS